MYINLFGVEISYSKKKKIAFKTNKIFINSLLWHMVKNKEK